MRTGPNWLIAALAAMLLAPLGASGQILLPGSLAQYPAPQTPLHNDDCVLGVQQWGVLPHTRCFDLLGLKNFLGGGGGIGGTINSAAGKSIAYYALPGTTISGLATSVNGVLITASDGTPSIASVLPPGLNIPAAILQGAASTIAGLPAVTSTQKGQLAWVTDCRNGSEGVGAGTGCYYKVDDNGIWQPWPSPSNLTITVGGQALFPGGATTNQGNGSKVQLSTGTLTNGHCLQADANGNVVDAGAGCGAAGGSGIVSSGLINQLAYYAANGTTVSGLTTGNNMVLSTNGSGVPALSATLPSGLTAPTMTLSNATHTGTTNMATMAGSGGKWTAAASVTGNAGLNLPQGVAPTSPTNGDLWTTSTALSVWLNGAKQGLASTTNGGPLSATSPVTISAAGVIACATCTTASGGALSGTAPIVLTGNAFSLGNTAGTIPLNYDNQTTVHNDTIYVPRKWPWTTGTIGSFTYFTGGTSTPSFVVSLQINGTNITGCNAITVSSANTAASPGTATCTALNTIASGQSLSMVTTGTSGTPFSAEVEINYVHSNP